MKITRSIEPLSFAMTEDEYSTARDAYQGICVACGAMADSVEPDAEEYQCEGCESHRVYGIEELLMMGRIAIQ